MSEDHTALPGDGAGESATKISHSLGAPLLHKQNSNQDLSVVCRKAVPGDVGLGKFPKDIH